MNDNSYSKCSAEGLTVPRGRFPEDTPLAMAYVPFQQWGKVYNPDEGFKKGTIFPDLDFPFMRGGGQGE